MRYVVVVASSLGGFLAGVGIMILLLSSAAAYTVQAYYAPTYAEVVGFKPMVAGLHGLVHSPTVDGLMAGYRELVATLPQLEGLAREYSKAYPTILGFRGEVERLYQYTHSGEYDRLVEAVRALVGVLGDPVVAAALELVGYGWVVPLVRGVPEVLVHARNASGMAKAALELLERLPPEKVEGYIAQLKALSSQLPPEKLEEYIQQARLASDRALTALQSMEGYPPTTLMAYAGGGAAAGTTLLTTGVLLVARARRRELSATTRPAADSPNGAPR